MRAKTGSTGVFEPAWPQRAAALPVYAVLALTWVLIWFSGTVEVSHESRLVAVLLNTLLVTCTSVASSWLAVRGYLASGLPELLYAGCGLIAMGFSFLVSSLMIGDAQGPNDAVTVHNLGVWVSSLFHLLAGVRIGQPRSFRPDQSPYVAAGACLGVMALVVLFWVAARNDLLPSFYLAGRGTTPLRQLVLTLSIAFLTVAAAFLIRHGMQRGSLVPRWYGWGLGLIALGLIDVSISVPGSILSWTGRLSQSLGHVYLLAAFVLAIRSASQKGFDAKEAAADYYIGSEGHYRRLLDTLQVAVITIDSRGRVVQWSPQAEIMFGYSRAAASGRLLTGLIATAEHGGDAFRKAIEERSGRYLELTLRRRDESQIPAEVLVFTAAGAWGKWTDLVIRDISEQRKSREEIAYLASFPRLNPNPITEVDLDGQVQFCNPAAKKLFPDLPQRGKDHLWLRDWSTVRQAVYERGQDQFVREVAIGGQWYRQMLHFVPESGCIRIYGMNITEHKLADEALSQSEARFRLLADLAEQLLVRSDPRDHLHALASRVMAHLDCHCYFNFLTTEEAPGRLKLNAWEGIPPEEARRIEWLDYGAAVCGCVARDGVRIVAEHIPTTPDERTELMTSWGIKAYACHPMVGVNGRILGTLSFGTRSRETFSEDDLALMKAVTDQVGVALVRMQSERDLRRSAEALLHAKEHLEEKVFQRTGELEETVATLKNEILVRKKAQLQLRELSQKSLDALEADRRSVARELHDSIGGSLAAIKFGLEEVAELAQLDPVCCGERLGTLISHLADTIKETKRISASLRPLAIDDLGLLATIEWYIRQFCQRYAGIRVVRQIDLAERDIPERFKIVVYRIMQEAFTNAARHSRADTIRIRLAKDDSQFELEVRDNGCGFDPNEAAGRHDRLSGFGLKSMQERAEICGAVFELRTRPHAGTCVRVTLPDSSTDSGL